MRLIDADELLKTLRENNAPYREDINRAIIYAPTIVEFEGPIEEVKVKGEKYEKVRHGKWIVKWWDEDGDARDWACSVCGFSHVYFDDMPTNYCPKCGAVMDRGIG